MTTFEIVSLSLQAASLLMWLAVVVVLARRR